MTAQEIKQKMWQGKWDRKERTLFVNELQPTNIVCSVTMRHVQTTRFRTVDDGSGEANAAAIVSAVNGTFWVGIDPSKVSDMVKMLQNISEHPYTNPITRNSIQSLLNSAKL